MTEGTLDGLSASILSNETSNDDGRAFLAMSTVIVVTVFSQNIVGLYYLQGGTLR